MYVLIQSLIHSQIDLSTATQKLVLCGPSPTVSGSSLSTAGQTPGIGYPGSGSLPPASPPLQLWEPVADLAAGTSSDDTLHYDVKELGLHTCASYFVVRVFVSLFANFFMSYKFSKIHDNKNEKETSAFIICFYEKVLLSC